MAATLLTATAYASKPGSLGIAAAVHVVCWLAQFYGHGVHEGRAPAVLDNVLGGKPPPRALTMRELIQRRSE